MATRRASERGDRAAHIMRVLERWIMLHRAHEEGVAKLLSPSVNQQLARRHEHVGRAFDRAIAINCSDDERSDDDDDPIDKKPF